MSARIVRRASWRACPLLALAALSCSPGAPGPVELEPWPEHLQHSVAAVGAPGAHRTFQCGPGASVWTGELAYTFSFAGEPQAQASAVSFERDGTPIAHWGLSGVDDSLSIEAAAVPMAALGDSSLLLSVEIRAFPRGAGATRHPVRLTISSHPGPAGVRAWDAGPLDATLSWADGAPVRGPDALAFVPAASSTSASDGELHATFELSPGEPLRIAIPLYPATRGLRAMPHEKALAQARESWRQWFAGSSTIRTGVRAYDALERASLVTLLTCEESNEGALAPMGNPFQYRDVWIRDGARVVQAFALAGQHALAADAVRTLARFQRPSGVLISQRGQLDGTGQALWAFDEAASRARDAGLARELLPAALAGVRWLRTQSDSTEAMRQPWPGMLPSGDPQDNELVRGPLVGNDAWALAGVRAAAHLAALAGDAAAERECREFGAVFTARFERAVARTDATVGLPPAWDGRGRDWGNLSAGVPTRALPPAHPRMRTLMERVLAGGIAYWGTPDSLHSYLGADLAMDALLMGEGQVARRYLDTLLAHSSSTLGQAEISTRAGAFGRNLPPHSTAAATAYTLVHALVATEDADTLVLGAGLDAAAWSGGAAVERTELRSGTLSATFAAPEPDRFTVRWSGVRAPARVRVPLDATLARVSSGGTASPDGRWITASSGSGEITFEARAGSGGSR